jgi:Kef-type K+ transport system membrane component KefB
MTFASPLALLLLQLAVILALSRAIGQLFRRFRQPQVIGEIVAGLMLGPSLFGWVWPGAYGSLFVDKTAMTSLNMLAQIGVLLFLFVVGLEFDPALIRQRGRAAAAISISGICVPFVLGFGIAFPLRHLFDDLHRASFFPSALFMGAAMSVTAFPVLARIVTEWNLQRTEEGALAIAAAAVDDVLAWTLLAIVVAFSPATTGLASVSAAGSQASGALVILGGAAVYLLIMFAAVRPLLSMVCRRFERQRSVVLATLMVTMLLSAFATEQIGIHALFGAFVAGLAAPKNATLVDAITLRIESLVLVFLLPIFFAYAGFKVDLRQLLRWDLVGYTALLTSIACIGKLGGSGIAAKLTGMNTRGSLLVGVLMNTRGLMELIILTVGLQLGVINTTVYGMMIVMALVTTAMAAPIIQRLRGREAFDAGIAESTASVGAG